MSEGRRDPFAGLDEARAAFLRRQLSRRQFAGGALGAAAGLGLAAAGVGPARAPRAAAQGELPADAAPPEEQVYRVPTGLEARVLDFYEQVYARPTVADLFSDALVRLTKDFEIVPGAATEWSGSEDGLTWTFKLDRNLVWSDGTPLTAADYVATFQYAADPAHAWDFTWFFQGVIKNWSAVVAPEAPATPVPTEQIGVRQGADEYEVVFEAEVPAPYLPAMLLYSLPLQAKALAEVGPLYNTDPATAVSSGPFILEEWVRDQRIVYRQNETYQGLTQPLFTRIIAKVADPATWFTMYQNGEVDYMADPDPASLEIAQAEFPDDIHASQEDFRTFYLFFDVTKAPFDDIKVRQAFSHVIDRDAIQASILGPGGVPAYSWLAPGFPASNTDGLADIQAYNPDLGRQLLAEAGYPEGEGFPAQEMWLRNENPLNQSVAEAIASMLIEELGIEVQVSNKDTKLFTDSLTAKPTEILFGYVSYGMDYLDPSNMLSVWYSGGRHSWANEAFDSKAKEAASYTGAPEERLALFQEAERILVEDVPGVFVYHKTQIQLIKPYVVGEALAPDKVGVSAIHWPGLAGNTQNLSGLYIRNDAPTGRE